MLTKQTLSYGKPLVVNYEFLEGLEARLTGFKDLILQDIADSKQVEFSALLNADADNNTLPFNLRSAARDFEKSNQVRFHAKWKNDLTIRSASFSDLRAVLEYENSTPIDITAEIGWYTGFSVDIILKDFFDESCLITISAQHKDMARIGESVIKFLDQKQPPMALLYRPEMSLIFSFTIVLSLLICYLEMRVVVATLNDWIFFVLFSVIILPYTPKLFRFYRKSFKMVNFLFGSVNKARDIQILFSIVLFSFIVPVLVTRFIPGTR